MQPAAFDWAPYRAYPLSEVIADFARPYAVTLASQGRKAFLARISALEPELRTLVLIETLHQGMGRDGLHTFLFLAGGDAAPEMVPALKDAGRAREAQLLAAALALFGPSYPADHRLREKLFGYWYGPELNLFDRRLMPIAVAFGDKAGLGRHIEDFVRRTPELHAHLERHRGTVAEETRLRWLQMALWREVDIYGPAAKAQSDLMRLPGMLRIVLLTGLFEVEFGNGGMHQLFFNATGTLVPEMLAAFKALMLEGQAAVIAKALAMFAAPYERDTATRRARHFQSHTAWDDALGALTEELESVGSEPPYRQAVLAFARANGLIPR